MSAEETTPDLPTTELAVHLRLDLMRRNPVRVSRDATDSERVAVAGRLGLNRITVLTFEAEAEYIAISKMYEVVGQASLRAERECVVTGAVFEDITQVQFQELFTLNPDKATDGGGEFDAPADGIDVELIVGELMDVGEVVIQYLAMELDPAPRAPGVDPASAAAEAPPEVLGERRRLPFAGLADMLKKP